MLTLVTNGTTLPTPPAIDPINLDDRDRAADDATAATNAGFSLQPPIYALGTAVNSRGVANFRQSRRTFEALPTAQEACDALARTIEAERRRDLVVDAPDLAMLPDGALRTPDGILPLSERAFDGLCRLLTPGGAGYLASCPTILRSHNVNHWLTTAFRQERGRVTQRKVRLRTRDGASGREIFSVVGPRYAPLDIDVIATQLWQGLPPDARADVTYDGYRARMNILFHSNISPERCVAGEIFQAGVLVTTADDGTGAIRIAAQVWRNLCRNLIIVDRAEVATATRHMGTRLAESVRTGLERARERVKHFADKWSQATVENVLERYGVDDVATVFRALVTNRVVHVPGITPEDMTERLQRAWDIEPGYSKTAIVNAITRAAHTEEWRTWTTAEDLERTAGELLYARVWNVTLPAGAELL